MADRVAIIGGSKVGRDHFVNFVPDGSRPGYGVGTYPFLLPISKACKWFYLVRRWSVDVELTATKYDGANAVVDTEFASVSFDFAYFLNFYSDDLSIHYPTVFPDDATEALVALSDRNLTSLLFTAGETQSYWDDWESRFLAGDDDQPPLSVRNFDASTDTPTIVFNLYLNPFSFFWLEDTYFSPPSTFGADGSNFAARTSDATTGSPANLGNFTVDGETTPIWVNNVPFALGVPRINVDSLNCTVTPISFWPYATKPTAVNPNGLPVYDTSTGEQLQNPLS